MSPIMALGLPSPASTDSLIDGPLTLTSGSPPLTAGSGDAQQMYNATTAQLVKVADGTAASPDTAIHPLVKVERTINIAESAITGDGVEQLSSLVGITVGTAACEVQPVGVAGFAKTSSTAGAPGNDAAGLYGAGRVTGSGTGIGIGLFALGRTDSASGKACGAEIDVYNGSGSVDSVNTTGFSDSVGLWMVSAGPHRAGVGIQMGNPFGTQFDVGLHFNGQVNTVTGPTLTADIQSDSNATNCIKVDGTHTYAMVVDGTAGKVVVGALTELSSPAKLELRGTAGTDPILYMHTTTGICTARIQTANGQVGIGVTNGADQGVTGTAAGDSFIASATSGKAVHLGGTVSVVEVTQGNALGFFNVGTPVTKQTVSGSRGGNAALASLLTALAAYGLVTDSSSA